MRPFATLLAAVALSFSTAAFAGGGGPYTSTAGANAPAPARVEREVVQRDGSKRVEVRYEEVQRDRHGNAAGNQHDLATDGAFAGQTVAVLHFCLEFDFSLPQAALKEKGFSTYRWIGAPPSPAELRTQLKKASQLWIISGTQRLLTDEHIAVIKEFFAAGHGLYIWGDNDPYYADANAVGQALFGVTMTGDLPGGQVVPMQKDGKKVGVLKGHLLSTGLENVFEGITIATIAGDSQLKPLIYGSAGNLVTAVYEKDGKRAIFDGGFTRLYNGWETAGTPRYVKNAAAWLANYERFGAAVTAAR
jgi:hypothetical protein